MIIEMPLCIHYQDLSKKNENEKTYNRADRPEWLRFK